MTAINAGYDSADHEKISEIIVRYLQSYWSVEVGRQIEEVYGHDLAVKAKAVYDEAIDCPIDWHKEDMNSALAIVSDFLQARFPWLTERAKTRLNYCFIMVWK